MDTNLLSDLDANVFDHLNQLIFLDLSNNYIILSENLFSQLKSLYFIVLKNNTLMSFHGNLFNGLYQTIKISIGDMRGSNKIKCSDLCQVHVLQRRRNLKFKGICDAVTGIDYITTLDNFCQGKSTGRVRYTDKEISIYVWHSPYKEL